jgi:enoyl-CoA hydratase/carnithine racemase
VRQLVLPHRLDCVSRCRLQSDIELGVLGADDFGAEQAERYGWNNRALPDADLDAFMARLARRIASFPADALRSAKRVLNGLTLAGADAIRADAPAPDAEAVSPGRGPACLCSVTFSCSPR